MNDYNTFFAEQMAEWTKTRIGPPPVYNPDMQHLKIPNHRFNLEQAIADMARKDRTLLMWIYENWALQQRQTEYIPVEKAELL
jgi:hypothetical protein